MATRADIRAQVYVLVNETSGNSHLTDADINSLIDQTMNLIAPIIQQPRKKSSGTQVTAGMGDITLPTDNLLILDAYYGDISIQGDIKPLKVYTEQTLKELQPSWMDEHVDSRSTPDTFLQTTPLLGSLFPRANTAAAATGKKVYFNYVYQPAALASDSESPPFTIAYHDIMKFYVCFLAYLGRLENKEAATLMYDKFIDHHKAIQGFANKETRETLGFSWGRSINADDESDIGIRFG